MIRVLACVSAFVIYDDDTGTILVTSDHDNPRSHCSVYFYVRVQFITVVARMLLGCKRFPAVSHVFAKNSS